MLSKQLAVKISRENHRVASSYAAVIPSVRATSPGAEIREEAERRAAQKALRDSYFPEKDDLKPATPTSSESQKLLQDRTPRQRIRPIAPFRRFHLYHGPRASHASYSSGIQKRKTRRRNDLATFVERSGLSRKGSELLKDIPKRQPASTLPQATVKTSADGQPVEESFTPASIQTPKTGQSMHDHPSTWDYDSDQLADELAAFALDTSQNEGQDENQSLIPNTNDEGMADINIKLDEDFIYDTYIRVPVGDGKTGEKPTNEVGLLVIDDEDQELWRTFAESDDDSEWDEEDPDSNGLSWSGGWVMLLTLYSGGQSG